MGNYKLSKNSRLSSKAKIKDLFSKGAYLKGYPISLQFTTSKSSDYGVQVIFIASKRKFRKAVERNRIKRVLREIYRQDPLPIPNNMFLCLAIIYHGSLKDSYSKVQKEYFKLKKRIKIENT